MYVFQMFDFFTGSRIITLIALSQLLAVLLYGVGKWYNGLALMLGFRPDLYLKVSYENHRRNERRKCGYIHDNFCHQYMPNIRDSMPGDMLSESECHDPCLADLPHDAMLNTFCVVLLYHR